MKIMPIAAILLALLLAACSQKSASERAVESMLEALQTAVLEQDVDAVVSHFVADAQITFEYPPMLGGDMDVGIDEYRSMLKVAWSVPAEYTYEVTDININLSADGSHATVTDRVSESMSMQGKLLMSTETTETMDVAINKGVALITRLHGVAEINL